MKPARHNYTILKQICQHLPAHLVPKLARSFGVDKKARSFSPWSHVVAMLHVQFAHSLCGDQRRKKNNDIYHEQYDMGTEQHLRSVQMSLGCRGVFQADKTDFAAWRLPWA